MSDAKYVKICPKCGSTNISFAPVGGVSNVGVQLVDYCKDCSYGYFSNCVFFPEIKYLEIEKFRKKLGKTKSNKNEDVK